MQAEINVELILLNVLIVQPNYKHKSIFPLTPSGIWPDDFWVLRPDFEILADEREISNSLALDSSCEVLTALCSKCSKGDTHRCSTMCVKTPTSIVVHLSLHTSCVMLWCYVSTHHIMPLSYLVSTLQRNSSFITSGPKIVTSHFLCLITFSDYFLLSSVWMVWCMLQASNNNATCCCLCCHWK